MTKVRTYSVIAISVVVIAGAGYAAGRYTTPAKVVIETKEVIKVVEVEKKAVDTVTTKKTITRPDGTKIEREKIVDKTVVDTKTNVDSILDSKTTITSQDRDVFVGILIENPLAVQKNFGVMGTYRVLGPLTVGGFMYQNFSYGVTLGLSF